MKNLILILLLIATTVNLKAQDTIQIKGSSKTWIYLYKEPKVIKGLVYDIKDSSVLVSNSFKPKDYRAGKYEVSEIDFKDIRLIRYRKNDIIGKSILFGVIAGAVIGGVAGYLEGDDPPCDNSGWFSLCFRYTAKEKALFLGTTLGVVGFGLGALSAIKFGIHVKGKYERFNKAKKRLKKRSLLQRIKITTH